MDTRNSLWFSLIILLCLLGFTGVDALRCYSCDSNRHQNCENLSEKCTHNIDCRGDFIVHCAQVENSCAVIYGSAGRVTRGCRMDPPKKTYVAPSNDQVCNPEREGRVCTCQVDMCNKSVRSGSYGIISTLTALFVVLYVL